MIDYIGKIAGVIFRGKQLHYCCGKVVDGQLVINNCGRIEDYLDSTSDLSILSGHKIICGINNRQLLKRSIKFHSDDIYNDQKQLLWELSRSSTVDVEDYYFSFQQMFGSNGSTAIEAYGLRNQIMTDLGHLFEKQNLVLQTLDFEYQIIQQMLGSLVKHELDLILLVEDNLIHLHFYHKGKQVTIYNLPQSKKSRVLDPKQSAEEIGILLMSVYGGKTISRDLNLIMNKSEASDQLLQLIKRPLPFDISVQYIDKSLLEIKNAKVSDKDFQQYFIPFSLIYLYNNKQLCELLPEKNAVWSFRPSNRMVSDQP